MFKMDASGWFVLLWGMCSRCKLGACKPPRVVGLRFLSVCFEGLVFIILECRAIAYGEAIYLTRAEVMEGDESF